MDEEKKKNWTKQKSIIATYNIHIEVQARTCYTHCSLQTISINIYHNASLAIQTAVSADRRQTDIRYKSLSSLLNTSLYEHW